ncbi:branched-chain amino acid ABC transporter permease [Ruminococcaceae bacterium OttesenSCG-928-A16]|nr:branched-chain amino acid ABC transporter permease [Ruminococcaceae bacterium OttesenSCG-928-A16]
MGKAMTKTKKRTIASLITLAVTLAFYFAASSLIYAGAIDSYTVTLINIVCVNVVAAVSLNMVTGLMGQLVLGHAGFMLIGAYTSAIFVNTMGGNLYVSFPISLLLGGLFAGGIGLVIGIPALRLRGDYLAIITLGFGEIIRVIANNLKITGGAFGYSGYPAFSSRTQPNGLFNFVFIIMVFIIFFSYTFGTSRHGRAVIAIREDEIAAESSGINTTYYKLLTFTLSACFAGIAGGLLSQYVGVIGAEKFNFNYSIEILMMVVLGGMGSITGSVAAAVVLTILPQLLLNFSDYRMLLYSIILILVMLFRPTGLLGRKEIQVIPLFEKLTGKNKAKTPAKEAKK